MLRTHATGTGVGGNPSCQTASSSDTNEKLFFELSESDGSNGDIPIFENTASSGETSIGSASSEDPADGGHFQVRQQNALGLQRERPATERGSEEPRGVFEPSAVGPEKGLALATPANRQASTLSAATASCGHPPRSLMSGRAAALPSFDGAHHAGSESWQSETAEEHARAQPRSLDLVAATVPLIPSFPESSAEVRVWVRRILLPCTGHALAAPPYVRASLYPGAHCVGRTGLPSTNQSSSASAREGGVPLVGHPPTERVVEYMFGGKDGGANGEQHTISLPLGPRVVDKALDENGGSSPPRIRLEIVSGRSLGWCDLALPEVLRRPGGVVRKVQVPVWRKAWVHGRAKNYGGNKIWPRFGSSTPGYHPPHQDNMPVGEIILDLGVMLSGEPCPSPPSETENGALELSAGTILVEAGKVRTRDTEKGGIALSAVERPVLIGVSSTLTLGKGGPKISAFAEGRGSRWAEEGKPGYSTLRDDISGHDGKVTLMTTCAELDILTLRLVQGGDGGGRRSHSSGLGLGQGHGRGGDALMIAVSDINDIFDGRWHWVAMRHDYFVGGASDGQKGVHPPGGTPAVRGRGKGSAGRRLEVMLRISLADAVSLLPHGHHRTSSTGGRSTAEDPLPRHKSGYLSAPPADDSPSMEEPPLRSGGTPRSALEAWVTSPSNGCAQATVVVPSQGTNSSGWATEHPKGGTPVAGGAEKSAGYPSQAGPGVLELEVLAIHGEGQELRRVTACEKDGYDGKRKSASISSLSSAWWVRVTFSNGGRGGGGRSDVFSIDSPPGKMASLEQSPARGGGGGGGTGAVASPPPLHQHDAEGSESDWVVRWPPHGGLLAKYPVHWTLSQNALPVVTFEVFRGQVRPSLRHVKDRSSSYCCLYQNLRNQHFGGEGQSELPHDTYASGSISRSKFLPSNPPTLGCLPASRFTVHGMPCALNTDPGRPVCSGATTRRQAPRGSLRLLPTLPSDRPSEDRGVEALALEDPRCQRFSGASVLLWHERWQKQEAGTRRRQRGCSWSVRTTLRDGCAAGRRPVHSGTTVEGLCATSPTQLV